MFRVFACLSHQHNPWLVILAAAICIVSSLGVFVVLDGLPDGSHRARWRLAAAVIAGCGTWATHFVAMLGYNPGLNMGFDLGVTLLSALTCILGCLLALRIFDRPANAWRTVSAGSVLGVSIAAMHFIGMAGVEAGARQVWSPDLVAAACLLCVSLSIASLHAFANAPRRYRLAGAAALLVGAIVALHFTAMGAVTLEFDPRLAAPTAALDRSLLGVTVATGAAGALLLGVVLAMADRRLVAIELAGAQRASDLARRDPLTGLPNRRLLFETFAELLSNAGEMAVIAIDLDHFKPVNDLYGHGAGDEVLKRIAAHLSDCVGAKGFAARIGGDEFVVLLPFGDKTALDAQLDMFLASLNQSVPINGNDVVVGATLGVARAPRDGMDADLLLRRADVALYRAKARGRAQYAFFEPGMDVELAERAALERDLRIAVSEDQIIPYFQPLIALSGDNAPAYEVLARWPHATRGLVSPEVFIPVAEETGVIGELTLNVLRQACQQALMLPGSPRIAVNIAPIQLQDPALASKILRILTQCGFPAHRLEIEITEDALVANIEAARALLQSLRNLGVRIALDDFGTGYSSLRHLRELPFDTLKIDRSFVSAMNASEEALSIVKAIIQLAKSLGLSVTAEGIETEAQAMMLQALGCQRGQGFLFGRPSPASHYFDDFVGDRGRLRAAAC